MYPPPQPQDPAAGLPPGLADMLGGAGAAGPPPPDALSGMLGQPPPEDQPDPLQVLQDAIHAVAAALHALPDAEDTQNATQALLVLSKIQTKLMSSGAAGAAQAR